MDAIDAAVARCRTSTTEVVTYSTQNLRDVGALTDGDNPVRATTSTS